MSRHIHVIARFYAHPDKLKELETLATALLAPTRAEPGCVRYELWQSREDPTELTMVEEWRSEADLDRHLGSAHVEAGRARLPALVRKPLEIKRFDPLG
jgi:quinol monooxygenase YgiN